MEVCKVSKCLFYANIKCSCSLKLCKLHYKEHSTKNLDHQRGHKIYHSIDKDSKGEILNFLCQLKTTVSQWAAQTKIFYIKYHTKLGIGEFNFYIKKILEAISNCDLLILKTIKTSKLPVKICYSPIDYFLMQPLQKTKKYVSGLNLNLSQFSLKILTEKLIKIQNHLYNYNYLDGNEEDFHGGEIQKEKELIMELLNIAGSLLNDDEYYNSKCLYKECKKILEKIQYHKKIDLFFIDYYIYMIQHRINPNSENNEPIPIPENFKSPYFVDFLDYISSVYVNWGESKRPKEFLKKSIKVFNEAFKSQDHRDGRMCFCKGLINLYENNFEKSDIYFRASKIYFKSLNQLPYLALMYYYIGFLYSTRLRTDIGIIYLRKSKWICKHCILINYEYFYKAYHLTYVVWSKNQWEEFLEKIYFALGYLFIYEFRLKKGEKCLNQGKKLLKGSGKRYDVAFFKLSIFNADLQAAYEFFNKIKSSFYVLPIQNRLLGWLYSEVGFLYFLFGDIEQAESYFSRINLDVIKASDMYNLLNVCILLTTFYIFTSRFQKAQEVLNIIAEKYEFFAADLKFYIDVAKIVLNIFSANASLQTDQNFEEIQNAIQVIDVPKESSENTHIFFNILKSACNESKFWNDLLEKLFDCIIKVFPRRNPLFAYIYQLKSKLEESIGNHEEARKCLFKSLEILKMFVSPKNVQIQRIEGKIFKKEKAIKPKQKRILLF